MQTTFDPLIVDRYALSPTTNWRVLASSRPWGGGIIKATQGTYYRPQDWFSANWQEVRNAGADRYGVDWLRGAYHYLDVSKNGTAQAEYFLTAIERAGGLDKADVLAVDVEGTDQPKDVPATQVEGCTQDFLARVHEVTGRQTILYAGAWVMDLGIIGLMGADWLWFARYTPILSTLHYRPLALPNKLGLWQYTGGEGNSPAGWPHTTPIGVSDISAAVVGWDNLHLLWEH